MLKYILSLFFCCFFIEIESCTSFYCINECGSDGEYKLIIANNRDENVDRQTKPAHVWPPKNDPEFVYPKTDDGIIECDQSDYDNPFDLCVYGLLDLSKGGPPKRYSTWLAINERGNVGNILFYMNKRSGKYMGEIFATYLMDSSWSNAEQLLTNLTRKHGQYRPFNYVHLEMSPQNGSYSLYYLNNVDPLNQYKLMNNNNTQFTFGLSNSDPQHPFRKVEYGEKLFNVIINTQSNKTIMVYRLFNELLRSDEEHYPDETLARFMNTTDDLSIRGVSKISSNYGTAWKFAHTRTHSVILVDKDNNVEYYEWNLVDFKKASNNRYDFEIYSQKWEMNTFKFKLKPLYNKKDVKVNVLKKSKKYFNLLNLATK